MSVLLLPSPQQSVPNLFFHLNGAVQPATPCTNTVCTLSSLRFFYVQNVKCCFFRGKCRLTSLSTPQLLHDDYLALKRSRFALNHLRTIKFNILRIFVVEIICTHIAHGREKAEPIKLSCCSRQITLNFMSYAV
jgi:hypothetical protein